MRINPAKTVFVGAVFMGVLAAVALVGAFVFGYIAVFTPGAQQWLRDASGLTTGVFVVSCFICLGLLCLLDFMSDDLDSQRK